MLPLLFLLLPRASCCYCARPICCFWHEGEDEDETENDEEGRRSLRVSNPSHARHSDQHPIPTTEMLGFVGMDGMFAHNSLC